MFKRTYPYFDLLLLYSAGSTRLNVGTIFFWKKELRNYLREAESVMINRNLFNFEHGRWKVNLVFIFLPLPSKFSVVSYGIYVHQRHGWTNGYKELTAEPQHGVW